MRKFLVKPEHGRVFKRVDAYTRVLVAIPGQEISYELAEECGLVEKPEPEVEKPEPEPAPKEPAKKAAVKPPASTVSYPTKTHKAV
jgi:hypothetical protein